MPRAVVPKMSRSCRPIVSNEATDGVVEADAIMDGAGIVVDVVVFHFSHAIYRLL